MNIAANEMLPSDRRCRFGVSQRAWKEAHAGAVIGIHLNAQLNRHAHDTTFWAEEYDRDLK